MYLQKTIKLSPLIILLIATVYLLISVIATNVVLVKGHIVGLILIAIAITAQFFDDKYGYWLTGFLLIVTTFSFAAFTPTIYSLGIGPAKIDPLGFLTAIVYAIVHRRDIPNWIKI
jgi:hypothetical protein